MKNVSDVAQVLTEELGLTKTDAEKAVKSVFAQVARELSNGEEVSIAGFGKFTVKDSPERPGRNPSTGEAVTIAASKRATFKAAKQLKEAL